MQLGAFSVSLAVKDIAASRAFYERLGFTAFGGDADQGWLILKNGPTLVGLFQGMFEKNLLTFNPGWDSDAQPVPGFTDVREIQAHLKAGGVALLREADEAGTGPAHIVLADPDGNQILVDQHVDRGGQAPAAAREAGRTVLLVVDVQVGVMANAWEAARVIGNVALAVERARAQGVPVVWVQHGDDDLPEDSEAWQLVPELVPAAGETRIRKRFNSAFEGTDLAGELARLGATHVVLAGAASNWCIRATAYGALDRGYDLTLVEDAHTTASIALEGGRAIEAEAIVRELNIAMKWLAYPGRRNAIARAASLDFAARGGSA